MAFPSTFADLYDQVIAKLRLDSTADLQKTKDWINQVYYQVCVETEATQTAATMTLTANSPTYTLPSAIIRIKQLSIRPSGQDAYGAPLLQVSLDEIIKLRQGQGVTFTGSSSRYCLVGQSQLELWPTPSTPDVMQAYYVLYPTALSGATDLPVIDEPFASKLLEYGALAEGADFLRDPAVDSYRQLYDSWMLRFKRHLNRKQGGHTLQLPVFNWTSSTSNPSVDVWTNW